MENQLQFGRLRGLRSVLLRRYEHRPLVWCLSGLSGCRWGPQRSGPESGDGSCSKAEALGLALLSVAFCITLVFLYFWGQAKNDYNDFDWFTFGGLGFWFPWSVVLLAITATFFSYLTALMLLLLCLLSERQRIYLHWLHKVLVGVVLVFSVVAVAVLSKLWSEEWTTLLLSFQITAPYLHVGAVLLMTALSWPVSVLFCQGPVSGRRSLLLGLFLLPLVALYLLPLGLYSPCIMESGSLGPRPALIGHRGAPMLAPENTLMSFEKAVQSGCVGLETDVTLSFDGMPFLMHDRTLMRTTNIREEDPENSRTSAAMFTWAQLQRLNAGAWFLKSDPFRSAGSLSDEDRVWAQNQSVCPLLDLLQLAARTHSLVIFDLYQPPKGHPYRDTWIQRTLDVLLNQSSIRSSQVLWLPSHLRPLVQETDPDLQQTSGSQLPLEELQSNNIVKLNLDYSAVSPTLVREYSSVNISVNLYVVSEPWLFSLAWCCGVQSVTTNAPQLLRQMTRPLLLMSPGEYRLMWALTDLLSLALVLLVFCFHWWRERALALGSRSHLTLDSGIYNKFTTELSEVWSVSSVGSHTDTSSVRPLTSGSRGPPPSSS